MQVILTPKRRNSRNLLTSIPATCRSRGRGNTSARVNIRGIGFPRCRGPATGKIPVGELSETAGDNMKETPQEYIKRITGYVEGQQPLKVQAATPKKLERLIKGVS